MGNRGDPPRYAYLGDLLARKHLLDDGELKFGYTERCITALCCYGAPYVTTGFRLDLSFLRVRISRSYSSGACQVYLVSLRC